MADELSERELAGLAVAVWREVRPGGVIWLSGALGSGKTTFARALTAAAGTTPARSPTYALVHAYRGPAGTVLHVDCYRLRAAEDAADLDLAALARDARVMLIEWPERAGPWAPPADIHLTFAYARAPDRRRVTRA